MYKVLDISHLPIAEDNIYFTGSKWGPGYSSNVLWVIRWTFLSSSPEKALILGRFLGKHFLQFLTWSDNQIFISDAFICHNCIDYRLFPLASYQIRKIAGCAYTGNAGNVFPAIARDSDMHHGTCVTHVPWCMPGSLTSGFLSSRGRKKTFTAFPTHAQSAIIRIR